MSKFWLALTFRFVIKCANNTSQLDGEVMRITQGMRRAVQLRPDATAVKFGDRKTTWRDLDHRVSRLTGGLGDLSVRPGDRVAVLMLNSDKYLELYLGVARSGAVIVPLNTRWSAIEIADALKDCGARLLFVDRAFAEISLFIAQDLPELQVVFADDGEAPFAMPSYEHILDTSAGSAEVYGRGDDLAGIYYTGGTSGRSKGVMLSHNSLVASAFSALGEGLYSETSSFLHSAPMFHLANGSAMYSLFISGGSHVVVSSFSPEPVFAEIERSRITEMLLVPTMMQALVDHPKLPSYDLSSVQRMVYGGSPISEAVLDRINLRLPRIGLFQCYGMTELSPIATILRPEQHVGAGRALKRHKSVGRAALGCDVQVVDSDCRPVDRGQVGQVIVRGDTLMMGYWNRPEETARALVDGWMHTGDAAYMDPDGYLYLVDRFKDMIISGGENVYSIEVENALAQHPSVAQCAVIGIPSEKWGEQVHAFVVPRDDAAPTSAQELIDFCKSLIAGFKCPRSIELRAAPLPLSGAGKILKNELRKPFWEKSGKMVN